MLHRSASLIATVLTFALLTSCVCPTNYNPISEALPRDTLPKDEIEARGGSVDWGLSLSGGGVRAGAFGLGVMKALYDKKRLESLDAVSTVSGGGYGWCWLLANNDPLKPFGQAVFNDKDWVRLNSDLQTRAIVAPYKALWRAPFSANTAIEYYEDQLESFADPRDGSFSSRRPIAQYSTDVRSKAIPYFLLNTTLITERAGSAKRMEISPTLIGNRYFGYHSWGADPHKQLSMVTAVAASGAVLGAKLGQKVPDYIHSGSTKMTLYDGGGGIPFNDDGENLGAYALIRRGIPNVIIVDAGADPHYKFTDYCALKKLLDADRITLLVQDVDNHPKGKPFEKSFCEGTAVGVDQDGRRIKTKITYIKMCLPSDMYKMDTGENGLEYQFYMANDPKLAARDDIFLNGKRKREAKIEWPFSELAGFNKSGGRLDEGFYAAVVQKYATSLNLRSGRARLLGASYKFPHMTTADQSYYLDQFEATLGLGYLQATAAIDALSKRGRR